jgi:hypothetical protein
VPGTRLVSCDLLIFVDEAGGSVASPHASDVVGSWSFRERVPVRSGAPDGALREMALTRA